MLHTDFIDFSFIIIYLFYCLHDNQYVMHQVVCRAKIGAKIGAAGLGP